MNEEGSQIGDDANRLRSGSRSERSPSLTESSVHYAWLVVLFVVLGVAGAVLVANRAAPVWRATASLVVEDPQANAVFDELQSAPSKTYVANQVEIIRSHPIATRAAELMIQADPPVDMAADAILSGVVVPPATESDKITISFDAADATSPVAVVNALALAYQEFSQAEARSDFDAAIASVETLIAEVESEMAELDAQLAEFDSTDPIVSARVGELTDMLIALGPEAIEAAVATETAEGETIDDEDRERAIVNLQTQVSLIRDELSALLAVSSVDDEQIRLNQLTASRVDAAERFTDLQQRRDQLRIDAELLGSGVTLFDPAVTAERANAARSRLIIVGAGLGLAVGVFAGYVLAVIMTAQQRRPGRRHA